MSTSETEAVVDLLKLGDQDVAEPLSETEERQRKAGILLPVLDTVKQLQCEGKLEELSKVANILGNAVRNEAWRLPVGDSGLFAFFLDELARSPSSQEVHLQCLRIVGNSCADTDENRQRFVDQGPETFERIMQHFHNPSLRPFMVSVLYNTLVDYEPAQLFASENKLNRAIITALGKSDGEKGTDLQSIRNAVKILWLLIGQEGEADRAHPDTVPLLLSFTSENPESDDIEDYLETVSTAVAYLSKEPMQKAVVADESGRGSVLQVLSAFELTQRLTPKDLDESDASVLKQLKNQLLGSVADLTAHDDFLKRYSIDSAVWDKLAAWLAVSEPASFPAAACLAMGNIARSDQISRQLIEERHIERHLAALLSDPSVVDSQLLHSALSFAKNLAISPPNKAVLGEILLKDECLPRVLALETLPQVQFAAVSLTRLLLTSCHQNVRLVCSRDAGEASVVGQIISLFRKSDAEPTQLEAARSVSAICRTLHSAPITLEGIPFDDLPKLRKDLYASAEAESLLAYLVTQKKWPILASETWFVLALMCRSSDGADVVLKILNEGAAMNQLKKTVTGREEDAAGETKALEKKDAADGLDALSREGGVVLEPQEVDLKQKANMERIDRENAVVMCTELIKTAGDALAPDMVAVLQQLITEGTEIVAQEKKGV